MPAKKAAEPAAASPKNVKAEKPAEEKKGGQKDAPARGGPKSNQQAAQPQVGNNAQAQAQSQRARPLSSDPAEAAIQRKLDDIEAKIAKYRGDLDKITLALEEERTQRDRYFVEQKKARAQLGAMRSSSSSMSNDRKTHIEQIVELRRVKKLKQDEAKKIKERLPHPPGDESPAGQEAYAKKIDDDIKALEKGLASNAFSLALEKKKVEEISLLQKAKKIYKEYVIVIEKINQDNIKIKELEAKLDETKGTSETTRAEFNKINQTLTDLEEKIIKSKEKGDALWDSRQPINADITKARADFNAEKEKLDIIRQKKWEEAQVLREKEREERIKRNEEKNKKWKEREAERAKEEDIKIPYEDEVYTCNALANYLKTLLPAKQKEVGTTAVAAAAPEGDVTVLKKDDDEGEFAGKKKTKKQKAVKTTQDLKHNVEVFLQFETLSLIPPSKVGEIEASIADLISKKDHYEKLSAATIKEKEEKRVASEAAKKAAEAAEAKPETPAAAADGAVVAE